MFRCAPPPPVVAARQPLRTPTLKTFEAKPPQPSSQPENRRSVAAARTTAQRQTGRPTHGRLGRTHLGQDRNEAEATRTNAADLTARTGTKTASTAKSKTKSSSSDGDLGDKKSEIREAWLFGSVALHQDPAKGETKGKEASGEALYLDNRGGEGKTITYIYQREPNEKLYLPGPLPPAMAANETKTITGAGIIAMNQATDQIWVEGPGTLTEISKRAANPPAEPAAAAPENGRSSYSREPPQVLRSLNPVLHRCSPRIAAGPT